MTWLLRPRMWFDRRVDCNAKPQTRDERDPVGFVFWKIDPLPGTPAFER